MRTVTREIGRRLGASDPWAIVDHTRLGSTLSTVTACVQLLRLSIRRRRASIGGFRAAPSKSSRSSHVDGVLAASPVSRPQCDACPATGDVNEKLALVCVASRMLLA